MTNTNQVQVFENAEFGKIEVLMIDGNPYFPATECAIMLGYRNPHAAVSRHCAHLAKREVCVTAANQFGANGEKTMEKSYIPEGDLYRLIIRSKLPAAVRFEAWVCDEVLVSIRKYGAYMTEEALRQAHESRDYAEELFGELSAEHERNASLSNYVKEIGPKARYYDIVLQSTAPVQISIIAKDYGMTAIALNKLLHKYGVQYRVGQTWLLYSAYANNGLTITRTYMIDGRVASIHTCWTQKGRMFIYNTLKRHGILPLAEKAAAN